MSRPRADSPVNEAAAAAASSSSSSAPPSKRPRHFHNDSSVLSTVNASTVGAAAAGDSVSSLPQLHRHALESIFSFLSLSDLSRVMSVSSCWLPGVLSMRPVGSELQLSSGNHRTQEEVIAARPYFQKRISTICSSRLSRHIGSLITLHALPSKYFNLITETLINLTNLNCTVAFDHAESLIFPAKLVTLRIGFAKSLLSAQINATIQIISRLPLLKSVFLMDGVALISFSPFQSTPLLEELGFIYTASPSDIQIDELRALPNLKFLDARITEAQMRRLLRQPHQLKWQRIRGSYFGMDEQLCPLLPLLPSLTQLDVRPSSDSADFTFLTQLPNLRELKIFGTKIHPKDAIDRLLTSLQECSMLTSLSFSDVKLDSDYLNKLIPLLPNLTSLGISGTINLTSLRFLACDPLTRTLLSLSISNCRKLPINHLEYIHGLHELTSLHINSSFDTQMDSLMQWQYSRPNSTLLPKLTHFSYYATTEKN